MDKGGKDVTTIGAGTKLVGELHHTGAVEVHGMVEGKIKATDRVRIADGGACRGSVEAAQAIIAGEVDGDVVAEERLELTSSARFVGDLVTSTLIVQEGASFVGQCRVSSSRDAAAAGGKGAAMPRVEVAQVQIDDQDEEEAHAGNGARLARRMVKAGE